MLGLTIMRTANAGVLVEMDGTRILLDGVCKHLPPYLGTPNSLREFLAEDLPDVLAFTHKHYDHYDLDFVKLYEEKTLRSAIGPESLTFYENNGVAVSSFQTRHIGKSDISHLSFVIKGSSTVWFMGDATPLCLKNTANLPKPDLLIVPFAYAITPSAWRLAKETGAKSILLLHMPLKSEDKNGLWQLVESTVGNDDILFTLEIGEKITI